MPRKSLTDVLRFISRSRPAEQDVKPRYGAPADRSADDRGRLAPLPRGERGGGVERYPFSHFFLGLVQVATGGISTYFSRGSMKIPAPCEATVMALCKRIIFFQVKSHVNQVRNGPVRA